MPERSLLYVEAKSGDRHRGEAWVVLARTSRSGRTVYFGERALHRFNALRGNHVCAETGAPFWVSRPKRDGGDRHAHGTGPVFVERRALEAYLEWRGLSREELDGKSYWHADDLPEPPLEYFHARENEAPDHA